MLEERERFNRKFRFETLFVEHVRQPPNAIWPNLSINPSASDVRVNSVGRATVLAENHFALQSLQTCISRRTLKDRHRVTAMIRAILESNRVQTWRGHDHKIDFD